MCAHDEHSDILIFANGAYGDPEFYRQEVTGKAYIIAVDGGTNFLLELGIYPDEIHGDFDSIDAGVYRECQEKAIPMQSHPSEKDKSDLELALIRACELQPAHITIYGALGKRVDHLLSNIMVLLVPIEQGIPAVLRDEMHEITIVTSSLRLKGTPGDYLSLFPLTREAKGIVTKGLKYALNKESLYLGPSRGLSNEFTESTAEISLEDGFLIAIKSQPSRGQG